MTGSLALAAVNIASTMAMTSTHGPRPTSTMGATSYVAVKVDAWVNDQVDVDDGEDRSVLDEEL